MNFCSMRDCMPLRRQTSSTTRWLRAASIAAAP
jgi:hypothetical protein